MAADKILNEEQIAAIRHSQGPLLIIAGAGTGKTTVITERIKYLILKKRVHPSSILALTFTEKAAQEMEERVDIAMPYGYTQMWICTFHAFCDRILRNEAVHIGLTPSYTLTTEAEAVMFLRKNIFALDLKYFRPLGNPNKFLEGLLQHFSRLADEDISPSEYSTWVQTQNGDHEVELKKNLELAGAYQTYQELKAKEGVMDFSGLITNTLKLFRERKNVLADYQKQFQYILVDEFQDTNYAQNQLAILLAGERKNITMVGDDDQAIYRWRGAAISNIIQFRKQFPKSKVITLVKNYRSTQEILDRAYATIQFNNPDRLEEKEKVSKKLTSMRQVKGQPIELLWTSRVENEADAVVNKILDLITKNKYDYKDFAILVRANDHAQAFVRSLQRQNLPFQFLGPGRLFHQEEIKDLIAYLKVLYNFEDSTSLYRVLALPIFAFDPRDIAAILNYGRRKNLTLFETLEQQELLLQEKTVEKLKTFMNMFKRHLKLVPTNSAGQILYYFLQDTHMLDKFLSPESEAETKKYQNIAKFFDKLKSFEAEHADASVFAVVDWIDLSMQMGESPLAANMDWSENNAVNILTIHSSKGLEFPVVFLVNLVNQRFPTRERREQIPIPQQLIKEILPVGDYHLQEERRLFYVGMTRARDRLFFSAANFYGEGKREKKLSPFIYEALGQDFVEKLINKQKSQQIVSQPSLLDWAERFTQKEPKKIPPNLADSPLTYISFSQLQTFEMCPLHYKLRYILKIPAQPVAPLSFGTSVHAALRDFYLEIIQGKKVFPELIIDHLKKRWVDEGYVSKQHQQEAYERAKFILSRYVKSQQSTIKQTPIGVEVPFQFYVNDLVNRKRSIKLGGRIDRIDRIDNKKIEIIDYKTGNNIPTDNELKSNLQLTLYALAANQVNDVLFNRNPEDVLLSLEYLEEEKKLTISRTREQLEKAKELVFEKIEEIERSDFICSGSMFCKTCEYQMLCHV